MLPIFFACACLVKTMSAGRVKRWWWCFRGSVLLCIYAALNLLFALAILPLFILPKKPRRRAISACLRAVLRIVFLRAVPLFGGTEIMPVAGLEHAEGGGKIFVSNHASFFDPFWALSFVRNAGVLVKSKYAKIPTIWHLLKVYDFVEVGGGAPLGEALEKAAEIIGRGANFIIFPEGTRTLSGRMGDFKSFAFKLSKKTGARVVPMSICTDVPFMARAAKSILPDEKARVWIEFHPPLSPGDFRDAEAMLAAAHRVISRDVRARLFKKTCPGAAPKNNV